MENVVNVFSLEIEQKNKRDICIFFMKNINIFFFEV